MSAAYRRLSPPAAQRRQRLAVGASPRTRDTTSPQAAQRRHRSPGETAMAGTYAKLFYHLVFSTKHRERFINADIEDELYKYISGIVRGIEGSCVEINGTSDHVHLLTILPPKIAVSDALREIKTNSSKWIHETKPDLVKFGWQDGYAAFTVSKSQVNPLRQYIRDQKSHHGARDFKAELLALFAKHEVEFDDRYIWD
jgi:REP element-mobilizing transposase RayT